MHPQYKSQSQLEKMKMPMDPQTAARILMELKKRGVR